MTDEHQGSGATRARRDSDRVVFLIVCISALGLATIGGLLAGSLRTARRVEELGRLVNRIAGRPADASDAARAADLGRRAIAQGRWDEGQVYLANAITNAPRDLALLQRCADAILARHDAPLEAIDRLSSMLRLAAYQADATDVPVVLALVEQAEQTRQKLLRRAEAHAGDAGELSRRWDELARADPELWRDPARLSAHVADLEDLVDAIDGREGPLGDMKARATAELGRWAEVALAARQCVVVDNCLARLGDGADLSSRRAVAVVQAADQAQQALWGLREDALTPGLRRKIDDYPARIQGLVDRIGAARSASALGQIREALATGPGDSPKWQEKCECVEAQIGRARRLQADLTSPDAAHEANRLMEEKGRQLAGLRNRQL